MDDQLDLHNESKDSEGHSPHPCDTISNKTKQPTPNGISFLEAYLPSDLSPGPIFRSFTSQHLARPLLMNPSSLSQAAISTERHLGAL